MALENFRRALADGVALRELWGWAMYDVANSSYTTVVITAVFNAYFVGVVAKSQANGTLIWTVALSISYALLMFAGPLMGAYADAHAAKKRLLLACTIACVLFTLALYEVGPGDIALGVALIILSNFFYGCGENLLPAFLPEIARKETLGKVSGWGWSLGYVGGLAALAAVILYIQWAVAHGQSDDQAVPATMVITAILYALFSIPTFLYLRERAQPEPNRNLRGIVHQSFGRVWQTTQQAQNYRDFVRFLLCGMFYQAGITTVITLAAIYAEQAMGFKTADTLILIFVVNITGAIGAFGFGYVQDRIGHKLAIGITLVGWTLMTILAFVATTAPLFWFAANLAGLCMGPSQSAGRALIGSLAPSRQVAEFYGLWAFATRISAILGPITYGVVTWLSHGNHRLAILITGLYFVTGLIILLGVNVQRGERAALGEVPA